MTFSPIYPSTKVSGYIFHLLRVTKLINDTFESNALLDDEGFCISTTHFMQ